VTFRERFARLPTAAKLLLILTIALLPIGIALTAVGEGGIRKANGALQGRADDQSRAAAKAIESLIARNALALRVAANGALAGGATGACERTRRALSIAPAVIQSFEIESLDGKPLCSNGEVGDTGSLPLVAPGNIRVRIAPGQDAVAIRVGTADGMATSALPVAEIRTAALEAPGDVLALVLHDDMRELRVLGPPPGTDLRLRLSERQIGNGTLFARVGAADQRVTTIDRLLLLLPVLMWVAAALISWLLVTRLLIRPLKQLERSVRDYQPGEATLDLPRKVGPSTEIQELRDAFGRAIARVDDSERDMAGALEGQRKLVREVHHRVKNNLQVIASLLNIHGRGAESPDARAAYAGISRRVGALSIVHRNHFAEMEENRGIALRPLIAELAAELRASAPDAARGLMIELDVESINTTQDVAVAVAFLITEIVECAMLTYPRDPIEISLRRTSELTARLTVGSPILVPDDAEQPEKVQFERIVSGLAKQLRSTLERKLGRYSVEMPAFPPTK
jgi:two-component sensor histidine kinase